MEILEIRKINSHNLDNVFEELDKVYGDITGNHIFEVKEDLEFLNNRKTYLYVAKRNNGGYLVNWGEYEILITEYPPLQRYITL